jgi:hypothetical protein
MLFFFSFAGLLAVAVVLLQIVVHIWNGIKNPLHGMELTLVVQNDPQKLNMRELGRKLSGAFSGRGAKVVLLADAPEKIFLNDDDDVLFPIGIFVSCKEHSSGILSGVITIGTRGNLFGDGERTEICFDAVSLVELQVHAEDKLLDDMIVILKYIWGRKNFFPMLPVRSLKSPIPPMLKHTTACSK